MIKPFVIDIPKESLTFMLGATRKAVQAGPSRGPKVVVSVPKKKGPFAGSAASRVIQKGGANVADETEHSIEVSAADQLRQSSVE